MTTRTKHAALVIAGVLVFAIYSLRSSVVVTDSGGIGAVSAGFAEAVIELVLLAAVVAVVGFFFYWRRRRQARHQSAAPRT